jgi:hypothetical protein
MVGLGKITSKLCNMRNVNKIDHKAKNFVPFPDTKIKIPSFGMGNGDGQKIVFWDHYWRNDIFKYEFLDLFSYEI